MLSSLTPVPLEALESKTCQTKSQSSQPLLIWYKKGGWGPLKVWTEKLKVINRIAGAFG